MRGIGDRRRDAKQKIDISARKIETTACYETAPSALLICASVSVALP